MKTNYCICPDIEENLERQTWLTARFTEEQKTRAEHNARYLTRQQNTLTKDRHINWLFLNSVFGAFGWLTAAFLLLVGAVSIFAVVMALPITGLGIASACLVCWLFFKK